MILREKFRFMLAPFSEMVRIFARSGNFEKSAVDDFAAPEYMPQNKYGCITCSADIFPDSSWDILQKGWAARKNWMPDRLKIEHIIRK